MRIGLIQPKAKYSKGNTRVVQDMTGYLKWKSNNASPPNIKDTTKCHRLKLKQQERLRLDIRSSF